VKKILLGLGLAAAMSSCVGTGLITVFGSDIAFESDYVLQQGSSQRPVICYNKPTNIYLAFNFDGRAENFSSFQVRLVGRQNEQVYTSPVLKVYPDPSPGVTVNGSRVGVQFGFSANTVPYANSVTPQAVIVNPKPVQPAATQIGTLDLTLSISDRNGTTATSSVLVPGIPVYDNCQ
jgi:hypothetical protein